MDASPSEEFEFLPLMPEWLLRYTINRFGNYYLTYKGLAELYSGSNNSFYTAPNISYDDINNWSESQPISYGDMEGPFVPITSTTGQVWYPVYWDLDTIIDPSDEPFLYWQAMLTGLATWQMYAIMISMQCNKLTEFGHYGRKKKG